MVFQTLNFSENGAALLEEGMRRVSSCGIRRGN